MRRWLSSTFIAAYLTALAWGIVSHALKWGSLSHPVMYYLVWDMFCGWQAYESRYHVVAEGASGQFYELAPGPWGAFSPYGDLPRNHYDAFGHATNRMALNTLAHTDHEPISRILVVEECWSKKYNLPDHLWQLRMDEPKEPYSYFWTRTILSGEGQILQQQPDFANYMYGVALVNNPRLMADAKRGRPFFAINPNQREQAGTLGDPSAWAGRDNYLLPSAH